MVKPLNTFADTITQLLHLLKWHFYIGLKKKASPQIFVMFHGSEKKMVLIWKPPTQHLRRSGLKDHIQAILY